MAYNDDIFTAVISEDGTIYEVGASRKRQAVGIDLEKESEYIKTISEQQEVLENYYNRLVELGAIIPQKTQEQILQEQAAQQAEINLKLLEAINGLQEQVKELKTNGNIGYGDESCDSEIKHDSTGNRKAGARSKTGDRTGSEDTAGGA